MALLEKMHKMLMGCGCFITLPWKNDIKEFQLEFHRSLGTFLISLAVTDNLLGCREMCMLPRYNRTTTVCS